MVTNKDLEGLVDDDFPSVLSRAKWKARKPLGYIAPLEGPVEQVYLTHAGAVPRCDTREECTKALRQLQIFHQERGAADLPYNFLVGEDKNVYEGRGWGISVPPPPQRPDLQGKCLVFAFIGPMRENYKMKIKDFKYAYGMIHLAMANGSIKQDLWYYRHIPRDWNTYDTPIGTRYLSRIQSEYDLMYDDDSGQIYTY